ncbi:MAG TPA: ribosome-associated translation inhibitor RaiA [Vicinamibacterales bacterium]|nr:ribosome-associated translation inhibitor RaiA [Vicinamibacterales bacterium]
MQIEITGRRMTTSSYLRSLVNQKLGRIFRHLSDAGLSAAVIVSREKLDKLVEVTVHARGEHFLHAVGNGPTWQFASTVVTEKLDRQARKLKGKWKDRRRR